jgi:hypothetical protein
MKNLVIFLLLALLPMQSLIAQKVKFRSVSKSELNEEAHPLEPEAKAAILHNEARRFYEFHTADDWFKLHTRVHLRIKVYQQEGASWADLVIPYHPEGRFSKFRASAFNLIDGKIVETKLENTAIFTEDIHKYISRRKIAMPGVGKGTVVDIEYELVEPASISLRPYYLQYSIPVNFVEYQVEYPEYFRFNRSIKGLPLKIDIKNSSRSETIMGMVYGGPNASRTTDNINYRVDIETFRASSLPSIKDEPFVTNMYNYYPAVQHELSFIQFVGSRTFNYSTTWDNIADILMGSDDFGQQINARLNDLDPIIEETNSLDQKEKYQKIYYWVRDNFQWNDYLGEQCQYGLRKLLKDKTGNIADINLLLINMLKKANLDVKPVVMSSRSNGFLNIAHPSFAQLNYVIAVVLIDSTKVFLDASDKDLLAGQLPDRALNMDGILIDNNRKGYRISIENPNRGTTSIMAMANLLEDMSFQGKARIQMMDYHAAEFRERYQESEREKGYLNQMHDIYPDLEVTNLQHDGITGTSDKVMEQFDFMLSGGASETGDFVYLDPMLIWKESENVFKSETRELPVFFNNRESRKIILTIKLPESYVVESLPKAVRLSLPDNMGTFLYSVAHGAGSLTVQYQYAMNTDLISPVHYEALRNYITLIHDKTAEKVVLKKVH